MRTWALPGGGRAPGSLTVALTKPVQSRGPWHSSPYALATAVLGEAAFPQERGDYSQAHRQLSLAKLPVGMIIPHQHLLQGVAHTRFRF